MQYSDTSLETTALVMYDPNTIFFYYGAALSYGSANLINIHSITINIINIISKM